MASRDWSELPFDLLGAIFNRLPVPYCLRVRAVCRNWWLTSAETPYRPTKPQIPWLVSSEGDSAPYFYSLSERKSYRLKIPDDSPQCIASYHGWLVFKNESAELHLLNPITGDRIDLPPVTTFPGIERATMHSNGHVTPGYLVSPPDPTRSAYFTQHLPLQYSIVKVFFDRQSKKMMVFVLQSLDCRRNQNNRLCCASVGDETWTEIGEPHWFTGMFNFAFHKGKLYGTFRDGVFLVVDNILTFPIQNLRCITSREPDNFMTICNSCSDLYLVDAAHGENLLLVLRGSVIRDDHLLPLYYNEYSFLVFRLDSESECTRVHRLEKTAIFVGENRSMAFSTRDSPELKENCIYFTGNGDEGVFHLEDESISLGFPNHDHFDWSQRHWFTPTL